MSITAMNDRVFFTAGENIHSVRREGEYNIMWAGVFVYRTPDGWLTQPDATAAAVAEACLSGQLDFNELFGSYRIALNNERTGEITVWGDNCGTTAFFYDRDSGVFSDSFLCLVRRRESVSPCHEAIARIFANAPEVGGHTPVENILSTIPEDIYEVSATGAPTVRSKKLRAPDGDGTGADEIIGQLVKALDGSKYTAVCTGGTDSRAVIASLIGTGGEPELIISGGKDTPDARIAVRIAERLGRPLTLVDTTEKYDGWLSDAFEFSDGCYDTVLSYRHMKKTAAACELGAGYEFGGCGGEFYKNDYYHKGSGIPKPAVIARELYNQAMIPSWAGSALEPHMKHITQDIEKYMSGCCRSSRLAAYNDAGRYILRSRMSGVSSLHCIKIDPLTEPRSIASVSVLEPETLEMHRWQRHIIAKYAPQLCDIETDQGYTCLPDEKVIAAEKKSALRKNAILWVKRTGKRLSKGLANRSRSVWRGDYADALGSAELAEALRGCRKLALIDRTADEKNLPITALGNIMRIGLLYSDKYGSKK